MDQQSVPGPLYEAVLKGDSGKVQQVLQNEPMSVYEKNVVEHTPLMLSGAIERPDIAQLLLEAGARTDGATSNNGYGVIHWALHHPPRDQRLVAETVRQLVGYGADPNAKGFNGVTPLMLAAWFGAVEATIFLLETGADRHAKDESGKTAKDMALQRQHAEIARLIENSQRRT